MGINHKLWKQAEELASRNYDVVQYKDMLTTGEEVILLKNPELPGCMAHGEKLDEAIANLKEARTEYIYSLLEDELPVPYPRVIATSTGITDPRSTSKFGEADAELDVRLSGIFELASRVKEGMYSYRGDLVEQT